MVMKRRFVKEYFKKPTMFPSYFSLIAIPVISISTYLIWQMYSRKSKKSVVLFTRYPSPGTTKTRLIPTLGEKGAAYCQLLMSDQMLDRLNNLLYVDKTVGIDVRYSGGTDKYMKYWLQKRKNVKWKAQSTGDLGQRLKEAAIDNFQNGMDSVVIIGADIPGINEDILQEAFTKLQNNKTDMVLGPAADGGYYLVGFQRKAMNYLDQVFTDIDWGTEKVFKQQVEKAKSVGAKLDYLSTVLNDVDDVNDLGVVEKEIGVKRSEMKQFKWSIIIPVYNEEKNIGETLEYILMKCSNCDHIAEIIVSDGGSTDNTVQKVRAIASACPVRIKVVHSKPGRGIQLRTGTAMATGDHFLFVHADTHLPQDYDLMASECLRIPGNVAGAYKFGLDIFHETDSNNKEQSVSSWFKLQMSLMEWSVELRCKYKELPWGDQGLFMSRRTYEAVGGYKEYLLMEDHVMVENLWRLGHVAVAYGDPIVVNSRRWKKWGLIRVSGLNFLIVSAYNLGVHPNTLARWYYGDKLKTKQTN